MNKAPGLFLPFILVNIFASAQPVLETGKSMPQQWIDKHTHHKIVRLSNLPGNSLSFYFHNNPFIDGKMVFYNTASQNETEKAAKQETSNSNPRNRQLYTVDLHSLQTEQLSYSSKPMTGEIVSASTKKIYYQVDDSVFVVDLMSRKTTFVFAFPEDFKASITCVNANGSLLGGAKASEREKDILKANPGKSSYFNLIYEAKLPRTLFTIDLKSKKLNKIFTDSAWLNHVQFSSTDPDLMMFCHEGPWHKVNRIWTINVKSKIVTQIHHRIMDMEIAGHEWSSADGSIIWYDLQQPRGETFFVEGHVLKNKKKIKYSLERNEWSIHFSSNKNNSLFCGDGGDSGQVAKASDGQWIYLFTPTGDHFVSEKLVNMKKHKYSLEPNVHFSPDEKWIIFRANFEGDTNIYAVEIKKSN